VRVPLGWLNEYVAVEVPVAELVRLLNFSGTKVEAVHQSGSAIAGVVTAEVVAIVAHPNADNLTLVDVRVDDDGTERVVCGAKNFAVGDLVPYARVGAHLPEMVISERKIRGEVSRGMLCSGRELGVGKDHSGILVLPPDAPLGEDVSRALGLDETILELELTPNRPDCMGMIGIAREVSALTGAKMVMPDADVAPGAVASPVSVDIRDADGCPRYVARYIEGVSVAPSPGWISSRLLAAGVRSVSNVVDVTNYVMLEMGQPLHPFDAENVTSRAVVVRRADPGEAMTTLDGVDRRLDANDLVIADPERSLALAGIMGGADSEVSAQTSAVILEAAYFDPASIARTSRRHQLRSEASARFERGMDPEVLPLAAARAVKLLTEVAGGAAAPEVIDVYPAPVVRPRITLRPARTDALLGIHVDPDSQASVLGSVGFMVTTRAGELDVEPPSYRPDVRREVDLIEEVARLEGLDKLPSTLPPGKIGGLDPAQRADRSIRRTLAALGVHEVWTTSFMSARDLDALRLPQDHSLRNTVEVSNPMSEEERLLRTSLLPGLLGAARHNLARASGGAALFEVANVYQPRGESLPREPVMLGGVFSGIRQLQGWNSPAQEWDFFAVKGVMAELFESMRIPPLVFEREPQLPFHPSRAARLSLGDVTIGSMGELHPEVCQAVDVPARTVVVEIALEPVLATLPGRPAATTLAKFPAILIDLAVVVDEDAESGRIEDVIRDAGKPETTAVRLFDVYTGPQVPEGKKSLAFALQLQVPDRTLTEHDSSQVSERILKILEERFGARLRT
jgi:phenylalanyl-tRNA synthetase beta chain